MSFTYHSSPKVSWAYTAKLTDSSWGKGNVIPILSVHTIFPASKGELHLLEDSQHGRPHTLEAPFAFDTGWVRNLHIFLVSWQRLSFEVSILRWLGGVTSAIPLVEGRALRV